MRCTARRRPRHTRASSTATSRRGARSSPRSSRTPTAASWPSSSEIWTSRCRPRRTGRCAPSCPADVAARSCTFCQIVAGEIPAHVVLDEPELLGFLDTRPVFKGHVLLVTREHINALPELPARLREPLLEATQRLARAAVDGLGAQG